MVLLPSIECLGFSLWGQRKIPDLGTFGWLLVRERYITSNGSQYGTGGRMSADVTGTRLSLALRSYLMLRCESLLLAQGGDLCRWPGRRLSAVVLSRMGVACGPGFHGGAARFRAVFCCCLNSISVAGKQAAARKATKYLYFN
jgi:hypothetical protein